MFNFFVTMIGEMIFSLDFSRPLMFAAIIVVLFLLSSPGAAATLIAVGVKLGSWNYIKEKKAQAQQES